MVHREWFTPTDTSLILLDKEPEKLEAKLQEMRTELQSKLKEKEPDLLFQLRLATNLGLIQHLFFSLYSENEHRANFEKLLDLLSKELLTSQQQQH